MQVLKFGGSSLNTFELFKRSAQLASDSLEGTRGIVVVSALGGTTNLLQKAIELAEAGQDTSALTAELSNRHLDYAASIQPSLSTEKKSSLSQYSDLVGKLNVHLTRLTDLLQAIKLLGHCDVRTRAQILATGERISALLFSRLLIEQNPNQPIELTDSTSIIKARGSALEATFDEEASILSVQRYSIADHNWWVCPGFIASDEDDNLVLLGRNGSDYSAAILAALFGAEELCIWTDVDGIYNADPNCVSQAEVIKTLSYREAMELSYFGAKVLHPKTIAPIASHRIPTRVKNTLNPDAPGSLIVAEPNRENSTIAGISLLEELAMINLSGVNLKGTAGLAERVFKAVSLQGISIVLISQGSSEYAISLCVKAEDVKLAVKALENEFALEIKHQQVDPPEVHNDLASISVVGDQMKHSHGVAANLFSALAIAGVNIIAIAQDASESSISVVIRQQKSELALKKVYEFFFHCPRRISVVLYGIGTIGNELLKQIEQQQTWLHKQRIELKVVGIANSKKLLWAQDGIELANWQSLLEQELESSELSQLYSYLETSKPLNPVFVDCTSSDVLAEHYTELFERGMHIVAANKKANTLSYEYYLKLRKVANQKLKKFAYETNVGAGLPIVLNIQNQVRSGDQLIDFSGILSGSLSFIMGKLDEGMAFSKAVKLAKEKGFTEPDPRDDLNGMDIARKLLIIAREFGAQGNLSDVEIEPLLPAKLFELKTSEEFLSELESIDDQIALKQQEAKEKNSVLRYAGIIDKNNNMAVKLLTVNNAHPLYDIKEGENAFSFTTQRYCPVPLVIRGYGAGAEVTAAGVFGDILQSVVS
ncbi:MAG: bifunctional aspartate kinase/homoserine dehydrogenase I [Gammaproteobacteria bacterium]|nr:bifunctional aspartate kinase/homoserine dehydrogenase I [Gammaproteobacteria bacterium]